MRRLLVINGPHSAWALEASAVRMAELRDEELLQVPPELRGSRLIRATSALVLAEGAPPVFVIDAERLPELEVKGETP